MALMATLLVSAVAVWLASGAPASTDLVVSVASASPEDSPGALSLLVVDVAGAVAHPGVYRLDAGSRIGDAIARAGGYGPRVDTARVAAELNLAAPLADGQHILVPSRDDLVATTGTTPGSAGGSGVGATASGSQSGLINLNRATSAELDTLPGIGPVTAGKIISSREEAPFVAVRDLLERKLIGQKTFDGLSDLVTVR